MFGFAAQMSNFIDKNDQKWVCCYQAVTALNHTHTTHTVSAQNAEDRVSVLKQLASWHNGICANPQCNMTAQFNRNKGKTVRMGETHEWLEMSCQKLSRKITSLWVLLQKQSVPCLVYVDATVKMDFWPNNLRKWKQIYIFSILWFYFKQKKPKIN